MNKQKPAEIVKISGLSKYFPHTQTMAVYKVELSIASREFVSIKGPSGSGKSTLLNLISGLYNPTEGEIYFDESPLSKIRNKALFRRKNIGFIFQNFYLYPGFTVMENVLLPLTHQIFIGKKWVEKARELLAYLDMIDKARRNVNVLSAGERQRVCIARALLHNPKLILADEPTGNLDSQNTEKTLEILKRINKEQGATILMASHDEQAIAHSHRTIELIDGRVKN
ncbi:ABC transporter ATP-binding protein [Thermoproteota archaeon]